MFNFFYKNVVNSPNKTKINQYTRDNSCNVTYNDLINNNLKKSIIIYDNSENFITKTPISSLDLTIPTHFKIYEILNDIDTVYYKNIRCDYEYEYKNKQNDLCDNYYENLIIQNNIKKENIKKENIKKFIHCFDMDEQNNV